MKRVGLCIKNILIKRNKRRRREQKIKIF